MTDKKRYEKPEVVVLKLCEADVIKTSYEFTIGQGSKNVLGGNNVMKGSDGFSDMWRK